MTLLTKHLETLDLSEILNYASEIGEMINLSADVADYLYWKKHKEQSSELQLIQKEFNQKKELFEECERFGHFHPNYHQALEEVNQVQEKLKNIQAYQKFKDAEDRLDDLLYSISKIIAHAVSDTIKVPNDKEFSHQGGCSSGGSCSGKCG